jgi:hypothetical protein
VRAWGARTNLPLRSDPQRRLICGAGATATDGRRFMWDGGKLDHESRPMLDSLSRDPRSPRLQFRWRAIPVAIVGAMGCAFVLAGLVSFAKNSSVDSIGIVDDIWNVVLGSCFVAASVLVWNGRWYLGLALIAACLSIPLVLFAWATMNS